MSEWVWLIGGGIMQIPMLIEISCRGLKVLVTDGDEKCPGTVYADAFFRVSTYDVAGHVELAKKLKDRVKFRAVLTVAADVGPTVSTVAEILELPACSRGAAVTARDKTSMRAATSLLVQHPVWMIIRADKPDKAWKLWDTWAGAKGVPSLPCIVKPPDNRGSRGSVIVKRRDDFSMAILHAAEHSIEREGIVLVEELLSGDEIAVDTFIVDREARVVNVAKRYFYEPRIEAGHVNPGPEDLEIAKIATEFAAAMGVDQGPFKLDMIRDERYGWCVLETATRLSGGFDHMYTAKLGPGKDITGLMLDYALGQPFDEGKAMPRYERYAACYAPKFRPGRILGYLFNGGLKIPDGVFILNRERIPVLSDSSVRPVFVISTGDTEAEAWETARKIGSKLEPMYVSE